MSLTLAQEGVMVPGTMLDWLVQSVREGKRHDRPSRFASAEAAIEAGNDLLRTSVADEITVFHRLHSNQACETFSKAVPADRIRQKAAHLEKQAQRAAKHG